MVVSAPESATEAGWSLRASRRGVVFGGPDGAGGRYAVGGRTADLAQFRHVLFGWHGGTAVLLVDGVPVTGRSEAGAATQAGGTHQLQIGY